uniref:Uncharacterized protein n=1 Tax=Alexandrium monilatum TaxID=311494 RepID=A0A7S4PTE7_9DINO
MGGPGSSTAMEEDVREEMEVLRTRLAAAAEDALLALPSPSLLGSRLSAIAAPARPFVLEPRALFVAWSGVLTLAYAGWPPQATALKARVEESLGGCLAAEQQGSKWPKTTLGALRDGRTLDLGELERLFAVLDGFTEQIRGRPPIYHPALVGVQMPRS